MFSYTNLIFLYQKTVCFEFFEDFLQKGSSFCKKFSIKTNCFLLKKLQKISVFRECRTADNLKIKFFKKFERKNILFLILVSFIFFVMLLLHASKYITFVRMFICRKCQYLLLVRFSAIFKFCVPHNYWQDYIFRDPNQQFLLWLSICDQTIIDLVRASESL